MFTHCVMLNEERISVFSAGCTSKEHFPLVSTQLTSELISKLLFYVRFICKLIIPPLHPPTTPLVFFFLFTPKPWPFLALLYNCAMKRMSMEPHQRHARTFSMLLHMQRDVLHNPIKGNQCGLCCKRKLPCRRSVKLV